MVATPVIQLALYLALYTGQRQGDLLKLMWSHYRDGRLYFRQGKGDRYMAVPCIARLRDLLDALRRSGDYTSTHILTAKRGQPWKKRWFSSTFADTCQRARITGLTFHDLRGTSITLLSEAGCTEAEIAAITGHSRKHVAQILERYTARTVLQANSAIDKLENSLRTNSANRLQTVRSLFSNSRGEDDASA